MLPGTALPLQTDLMLSYLLDSQGGQLQGLRQGWGQAWTRLWELLSGRWGESSSVVFGLYVCLGI